MKFEKFSDNPVLRLGERNTWDGHNIFAPMVVKSDGIYFMYYSGGPNGPDEGYTRYQLGLAVSNDGFEFRKHAENPLIPLGERDNFHVKPALLRNADGSLCREDGQMKMWYNGNRANDIEYATSEDGIHWEKYSGNPVFQKAYAPTVIRDGERYRMWYTMGDYGAFRIGYAESLDGISWKAHDTNPVMVPSLEWEMNNVFYPFILKKEMQYTLFYTVMGGKPHQCNIAVAKSADGLSWDAGDRYLILKHGPQHGWDGVYASCPCLVVESSGQDKLYYAGRIDMLHKYYAIGVAIYDSA